MEVPTRNRREGPGFRAQVPQATAESRECAEKGGSAVSAARAWRTLSARVRGEVNMSMKGAMRSKSNPTVPCSGSLAASPVEAAHIRLAMQRHPHPLFGRCPFLIISLSSLAIHSKFRIPTNEWSAVAHDKCRFIQVAGHEIKVAGLDQFHVRVVHHGCRVLACPFRFQAQRIHSRKEIFVDPLGRPVAQA